MEKLRTEMSDVESHASADPLPAGNDRDIANNASGSQLLRNFFANYLSFGAAILLSLLLTPIVLHHAGTVNYGLWITLSAAGSYVGLLDAGVSTAAVREIAAAIAKGDEEHLNELFDAVNVFFVGTGAVACAVTIVGVPLIGKVFSLTPGTLEAARIALVLEGVWTAIGFLKIIPTVGLYGSGRSDIMAFIGVGFVTTTQAAQIVVTLLGGGLVGLFAAATGSSIIALAVSWRIAQRFGVRRRLRFHLVGSTMRALLIQGWDNTLISISGIISYRLDAMLIAVILPITQVAPYDIALSTANLSGNLATTGTSLLLPAYAHSHAVNDTSRQFTLFSRAVMASMAIAMSVTAALIAFGQPILVLWLGHVPAHTYEILVVMNLVFVVRMPGRQATVYLTGIGKVRQIARLSLIFAVTNFGMSVATTFWLGAVGPVVGSIPQVLIFEFVALPVLCLRELGVTITSYLKTAIAPLAAPLGAAASTSLLLRFTVHTSEVGAPFEAVAVVVAAVLALGAWFWITEMEFREVVGRHLHRGGPSTR